MNVGVTWPESAFWDFSLDIYGRRGIEAACVDLQRRHDLDVNVLLLCCWLASRGIRLDDATAARIERAVRGWQTEVVRTLRALRRRLKVRLADPEPGTVFDATPDVASALRARVLDLELDGEHLEQIVLEDLVADLAPTAEPGPALATHNVRRFWSIDPAGDDALRSLFEAVFPASGGAGLNGPADRPAGAAGRDPSA